MKKINQIYLLLSLIFVGSIFLAAACFYYSNGYKELSESHINTEITNQINSQKDINNVREIAHHYHVSYKDTLSVLSNSFSNFGEVLISIALLCLLLIVTIYKSKFLTSSSSGRKKHAA